MVLNEDVDAEIQRLFEKAEFIPWTQPYRKEVIPKGQLRVYVISSHPREEYCEQHLVVLAESLDLLKTVIERNITLERASYFPFETIEEKPLRTGVLAEHKFYR